MNEWICGYCETSAHDRCVVGSQALIDGEPEMCACGEASHSSSIAP